MQLIRYTFLLLLSAFSVLGQQTKVSVVWPDLPQGWEESAGHVSYSTEEREGFTRTFAYAGTRFLGQIFDSDEALKRYYYEQVNEDGMSNLFIRHLQRDDGVDDKEREDPLIGPDEVPWNLIYERSGFRSIASLQVDGYEARLLHGDMPIANTPRSYLVLAVTVEDMSVVLIGSCETAHCAALEQVMRNIKIKIEGKQDPERVMIAITSATMDTSANTVHVTGTYRSKSAITSATIFRALGGSAVQGNINYANGRFTASCDFAPKVDNTFRIVFDNADQKSAEQNISFSAQGKFIQNTTTNAVGNTQVNVPIAVTPGLGSVGNIPGPASLIQGILGVVAPGVLGILGGLLGGLFGGGTSVPPPISPQTPPPTSPQTPKKPKASLPVKPADKKPIMPQKPDKNKPDKDKPDKNKQEKDKQDKEKKREDAKQRAKKILADQQKAQSDMNSWSQQFISTISNAGQDIKQGYRDVRDVAIPIIKTVADETKSAIKDVVKDPKILIDTAAGTIKDVGQGAKDIAIAGKDVLTHPIDIGWETVKGTASDVKTIATETYGKAFVDMVKNPKKFIDFVYNASGAEDLNQAMNPNLSLVERSAHYGAAVYKTILNVMGAQGLKQGGMAAVKALGVRGLSSTIQYGGARNLPVFTDIYHKVGEMSKAGEKYLGVPMTTTQKLKITTGLFLEWYKHRYDEPHVTTTTSNPNSPPPAH